MVKTAVLILSFNSQKYLANCLKSLNRQIGPSFHTYLIDNNSSDESIAFVSKNFPEIKIIKHPQNFGVGKGFNLVISKLLKKYRFFCLLNPDVVLSKSVLQNLHLALKEDKSTSIVAANVIYHHNHLIDTLGGELINPVLGIFGGVFGGKEFTSLPKFYQTHNFPVFFGVITCMLVRQEVFIKYGLFDENYFMYFEDIDLCWRVRLGGNKIVACPKATVFHIGHASVKTKAVQNRILKISETNLLLTYYKNLSWQFAIVLLPLTILFRTLLSLIYLPISPKITTNKLIGIVNFLLLLVSRKYLHQRKSSQNLRKISDFNLLFSPSNNQTALKSNIIKTGISWFHFIKTSQQKLVN